MENVTSPFSKVRSMQPPLLFPSVDNPSRWPFLNLNHFKIIRSIVKSLIATSTYFLLKYNWKNKTWKVLLEVRVWSPKLVYQSPNCPGYIPGHGVIILNRSNNSVFLYLKIYWNWQVFDLICISGIWMKPETLCHQVSSKF